MGCQFAHTETYARQISRLAGAGARTARQAFAALAREPGHCEHVRVPPCPVELHGMSPAQAEAEHDPPAAEARTPAGRRIRADLRTLYTEVHSLPWPPSEVDRPEAQDWLRRITASRVEAVEARGGRVLGGSRPSTWWKLLVGLRRPRIRRPWVGVAGFRWSASR